MEARTINNRDEFAQWAIDRANVILTGQGSDLATAARSGSEERINATANALGQAIVDAFDGLTGDE